MRLARFVTLIAAVIVQAQTAQPAAITLSYRRGTPNDDRRAAYDARVSFASWVDDDRIVYSTAEGPIRCLSISQDEILWSRPVNAELLGWSSSTATRRLAVKDATGVTVLDCDDGNVLFAAGDQELNALCGIKHFSIGEVALSPKDG